MNELALFAGAGGGILGGHLLGWRTVCAVEWDAYACSVLCARQNDGVLPPFPVWDDVCSFDGRPWRGRVDVVSGGFPCVDISAAGKGAGIDGEHSGLWREMARIIGEVRPRFVFVENSPLLVSRGLARVLSDLASLGYDARWGVLGADDAGAPHRRKRIWIVAHHDGELPEHRLQDTGTQRQEEREVSCGRRDDVAHAEGECSRPGLRGDGSTWERGRVVADGGGDGGWWQLEPNVDGMADGLAPLLDIHGAAACGSVGRVAVGVPARVQRLKCIGNGQVPAVAAMAWKILTEGWTDD